MTEAHRTPTEKLEAPLSPMSPREKRFYELYLQIGNVRHWLGNGCDPDGAVEELDLIMEQLRKEFP